MRVIIIIMVSSALVACGTIPSPTEKAAQDNFQWRVTEVTGLVEDRGDLIATGKATGKACIFTAIGAPTTEFTKLLRKAKLKQGGCELELGPDLESEQPMP